MGNDNLLGKLMEDQERSDIPKLPNGMGIGIVWQCGHVV